MSKTNKATIQDQGRNYRNNEGKLFLLRCYVCKPGKGKENCTPLVSSGQCGWCGWSEDTDQSCMN